MSDRLQLLVEALLERAPDLIELLTGTRALLCGQILEPAQEQGQSPLATQNFDPQLLDLRLGARLLDSIQNLSLESF
jgi:hypothetical protein